MTKYNPPSNWPTPPKGWTPPAGWKPDPAWGPPPAGWHLWIEDQPVQPVQQKSWFARHKILTGLGALVAVSVIGGAIGGGGDATTASPGLVGDSPTASTSAGVTKASATRAAKKPTAKATSAGSKNTAKAGATTPDGATSAQATGAAAAAGIGDKVRDGSFEFTVKKVNCGVRQVGDTYLNKKAQGQFCVISGPLAGNVYV